MRNFTCSQSEFNTFYKEINKELCDKFESILEGSGVYVATRRDSPPAIINQVRTYWGTPVEITFYNYSITFWLAGQEVSTDSWEIQVELMVEVLAEPFREDLYLNPKDFFQDWINPTEAELESFEQEAGYPYPISNKFIKNISQKSNTRFHLRRA